jgi:hypothetical protein
MVDILGVELVIVFVVIVPFFFLAATALRRFLVRGHVWFRVKLPTGRWQSFHQKPDGKGDLHALKGTYHTRPDCMALVHPFLLPEAPGFEYKKGNPWPLAPHSKQVWEMRPDPKDAANGGQVKLIPTLVGYEAYLEPQVLPAETQETINKSKLFADIYGGRERLLVILAVLMVVVILLLFVVLARSG